MCFVTFFMLHDRKYRFASSMHWTPRCRNITLSRCLSKTKFENRPRNLTLWQLIIVFSQITQLSDKCLWYPADSTHTDGIWMFKRFESRWQSESAGELLPALRTGKKVHREFQYNPIQYNSRDKRLIHMKKMHVPVYTICHWGCVNYPITVYKRSQTSWSIGTHRTTQNWSLLMWRITTLRTLVPSISLRCFELIGYVVFKCFSEF